MELQAEVMTKIRVKHLDCRESERERERERERWTERWIIVRVLSQYVDMYAIHKIHTTCSEKMC